MGYFTCPIFHRFPNKASFDPTLSILFSHILHSGSHDLDGTKLQGGEGVDVKEGSRNNVVEGNEIFGQIDPDSGGT